MEYNFWIDLLVNALGGLFAAAGFAVILYFWKYKKRKKLDELSFIMGELIVHRNKVLNNDYQNENSWVEEAKALEKKAINKANELSPYAGALLIWLDKLDRYHSDSEKSKYSAILGKLIERIRNLLERNTVNLI